MSRIRILPDQLANQIAAGEVVERPASVVKELLENSLDAGARRIEIDIEGGGTRLIRVIDNGEGMDEDDLLLSLERHGTSKIAEEQDLGAIESLGFRGEALPSIGSVAKMTLTSRRREDDLGTRVVLNFGKLAKVHEMGCAPGTTIEVRSLFGNTPARRKFLRTNRTEQGHLEEIIKNYALARPTITFILRVNDRETLHFNESMALEARLAAILRYDRDFIAVSGHHAGPGAMDLSGFLVPPETVTTGPARMRLFVNGRAVRDRLMNHAVHEGLRSFLMKGRNPMGMLHLLVPADQVDVNVHPAKHEVRFRQARDVHTFVSATVADAMGKQQRVLRREYFSTETSAGGPVPLERATHTGQEDSPPPPDNYGIRVETREEIEAPVPGIILNAGPLPKTSRRDDPFEKVQASPDDPGHSLLVIGQFEDLYIFCQSPSGLVVIDQHAAHERILFEKLKKNHQTNTIPRQRLLFPETIELTPFQSQLVDDSREELENLGFSLREFGGNTYVIEAAPAVGETGNTRELFFDVLDQFGNQSGQAGGTILDTILATMACRAAVKGGTSLSPAEIDSLLAEMVKTDLFSHCPHGRPVVKNFSRDEIKKWFYRN
jgi:DNA mismatch repair protein MutL